MIYFLIKFLKSICLKMQYYENFSILYHLLQKLCGLTLSRRFMKGLYHDKSPLSIVAQSIASL